MRRNPITLSAHRKARGEEVRETCHGHLFLGPRHIVANSLQLQPTLFGIEEEVAGPGISVPRLAHRSHIHQVAKAGLQFDARSDTRPALPLLIPQKEDGGMGMSEETDLAREVRKGLLGILQAQYIFPPLRIFGSGVDKKKSSMP